ncbi:flagellar biosynthesis protein FlhB [Pseudomonas sp. ZM23]|uniref:Flagellar biosynthetic protein FlhB n=1 Tax=Pseudomonas triclosanedens TaxID=2961893 RepID=A0ABY6ZY64_9PSED|nr:flagellar biosynthesis protein FlhB [Pseudomonas triclosanedens]MCP8462747.1 flagellar biosynthesis protein FlhB [Pseudomonas triclosanedens]MCP8468366.1 flagellar biosynthesis protein FlhB [Pseudomonas triclosanedens]MCP8475125.1 flagellar biosynthesis protein FlhB [Pseudomonas triclosanedens]WAI49932.1 flagellar biosynthesis protein FlhB [Pseudomonas triclosanedens]
MADQNSAQEKTEEASQQKLKKSREEGQVSRSKDLSTTLSLLATLVALKFSVLHFYNGLKEGFALSFIDLKHSEIGLDDLPLVLGHHLVLFVTTLLPLLVTPLLVVLFSMIPGGWIFSSNNFMPKFSKLNPLTGLGRIFSMQNWTELGKSLLKIAVLIAVAVYQLLAALPGLLALQRGDVQGAIGTAFGTFYDITLSLLVVFILFSLIDIPLQYFFFKKKLRMTKQERKEEHKNQEGRPEVKARIRQLQRQLVQRQINKVIKTADVVIVNPVHFAVALRYDPKKAQAPYVVAKGLDETALYIRKMARAHDLEVLELPPLARAIYATTQVNQQIPAQLYKAVAHVLTYILQLKAWRSGRRERPELIKNLPIPEELVNRV